MSNDQPEDMATPTMAELHAKLEIINNAAWRHADNSDNFDLEKSIEKGYQDIADALDELERARDRIAALEAREAWMRAVLAEIAAIPENTGEAMRQVFLDAHYPFPNDALLPQSWQKVATALSTFHTLADKARALLAERKTK